jgi:hypothetical protein
MMLRHVVMWTFKEMAEGADKNANMGRVRDALLALKPIIPEIRQMEIGEDIGIGRDPWDMVLVMGFDDAAALGRYQHHPEHKKISGFVAKVRDMRACVDFTIPDP